MGLPAAGPAVKSDAAKLRAARPGSPAALLNGVGKVGGGFDGISGGERIGMAEFDPDPVSPREGGSSCRRRSSSRVLEWKELASDGAGAWGVNFHGPV